MFKVSGWRNPVWPDVTNAAKAHNLVEQGFWVLVFAGCITAVAATVGVLPLVSLVDAVLAVVLAVGLRMRMRSAAVIAFLFFLLERIQSIPSTLTDIVMSVFFLIVFIHMLRAIFSLWELITQENPAPEVSIIPPLRKVDILVCTLFVVVIIAAYFLLPAGMGKSFMVLIAQHVGMGKLVPNTWGLIASFL